MANPSHTKSTMAQKEYVKAIVHQLSLQRFSDPEMVEFLAEKGIVISRSRVNQIKTQIEKQAEKWYIDLKQSRYKYIATYKERLDSLLSYQRRLNDIISTCKKPEVQVRAIGELVSIEKTVFDIWKQLPDLDIVSTTKQEEELEKEGQSQVEHIESASWVEDVAVPSAPAVTATIVDTSITEVPEESSGSEIEIVEDKEEWKQLQCPACKQWFMNNFTLSAHKCTTTTVS